MVICNVPYITGTQKIRIGQIKIMQIKKKYVTCELVTNFTNYGWLAQSSAIQICVIFCKLTTTVINILLEFKGIRTPINIAVMKVTITNKTYEIERLIILDLIRQKTGLSLRQLATDAGYFQQQMYHWYDVDDITIEQLYKIADAQGLKVDVSFDAKDPMDQLFSGVINYGNASIELGSFEKLTEIPADLYVCAPEIPERAKGGRLKFLAEFVIRHRVPYSTFCRTVGHNPAQFKVWMETDNIKLSKIYDIANAYGTQIKWKLSVKE